VGRDTDLRPGLLHRARNGDRHDGQRRSRLGQFWLVFGLVAWAVSTAIGVGFLTPRIKRLNALIAEHGERDPAVQAVVQPILLAARLDIALRSSSSST
jgi:hypothetical protein